MLYDPKWEQQTKADPLTVEAFIAWLETQPGDREYEFMDCNGACLLGQYMSSLGIPFRGNYRNTAMTMFGSRQELFGEPDQAVLAVRPHTFGAALQRARKFAAQRS